jgi:hypothetical protein
MFRVAKQQPFLDFKSKLAQDLGYQPNQIRFWVLVNLQNKTVRPDTVVPEHDPTLSKFCNVVPEESLLSKLTLRLSVAAMEVVRDKFVHNTNRKGSLLTCAIRPAEVFRYALFTSLYLSGMYQQNKIEPSEIRPGVVAHVYRRVQCPFPAMVRGLFTRENVHPERELNKGRQANTQGKWIYHLPGRIDTQRTPRHVKTYHGRLGS